MTDTRDPDADRKRFEDIVTGGPEPTPPREAKTGRARPKWVLLTLLIVAVVAGGWFLVSSQTVMKSTHDEIVANLDASEAALSAAEAKTQALTSELATITADLEAQTATVATLNVRSDEMGAENAALVANLAVVNDDLVAARAQMVGLETSIAEALDAIGGAHTVAVANSVDSMWITTDFYNELVTLGVPTAIGDGVIELLDDIPYESWESYAGSNSLFLWGAVIRDVEIPELSDAFTAWSVAAVGSDAETAAYVEIQLHTMLALLERLDTAQAIISEMVRDLGAP